MFLRNSVLASDKGTNTAYFGRFQAAVDN